jgi:hypothetical protein
MMYYQNGKMIIRSDGAQIPIDNWNADYMVYQQWVQKGGIVGTLTAALAASLGLPFAIPLGT